MPYAKVTTKSYTFRRSTLAKGTIVELTAAQLKDAKAVNPPNLVEVDKPAEGVAVFDIRPKTFARELQASETGTPPERASLKPKK